MIFRWLHREAYGELAFNTLLDGFKAKWWRSVEHKHKVIALRAFHVCVSSGLNCICLSDHIDRYIHKCQQNNYSFLFMVIILTSLVSTNKMQNNFCFKVRLTRMISTKTKE